MNLMIHAGQIAGKNISQQVEPFVLTNFPRPLQNLITIYKIKVKLLDCNLVIELRGRNTTYVSLSSQQIMAMSFQRNQLGMKVTGTHCTVPNNPKAKLMYYLNCMATVRLMRIRSWKSNVVK